MPSVEDALRSQVRNIEAKYGRPISGWIDLVRVHGLTKHGEILALLKTQTWPGRRGVGSMGVTQPAPPFMTEPTVASPMGSTMDT